MALGQASSTSQFTASSITGSSYVFVITGVDKYGTLPVAGAVTFDTSGAGGGALNWNDGSGMTPPNPIVFTCPWTVDHLGRVALLNLTGGVTFSSALHPYLARQQSWTSVLRRLLRNRFRSGIPAAGCVLLHGLIQREHGIRVTRR